MWNSIKKLRVILTRSDRFQLVSLLGCVLVATVFEVIGVFSVLPFMQVVSTPELIKTNEWLKWLNTTMEFSSDRSMMVWMGVGVLGIYFLTALVNTVNGWLISRTVWRIAHLLCMRLLHRYTQMPFEFFLRSNSAELVKKVISDIHSLVSGVIMAGCQFLASAFKILFILLFLFVYSPKLALLAFVIYGSAYGLLHLARHRYLERLGSERLETISMRIKLFTETLSGIRTLRVNGATNLFVNQFETASARFSDIQPRFLLTNLVPKHVIELLAFSGIIGIVLFVLINGHSLLEIIPTLSVFAIATYKLLPALNSAFYQAANFSLNLPVIDVVYEDLRQNSDLLPPLDQFHSAPPVVLKRQIHVDDVTYRYDEESVAVLNGINLKIEKGSRNALVGTTGCGKSTLIDVMVGLLFPEVGSLVVDGTSLTRKNVSGWQRKIAYVPQEVFLYDVSIAANIALGVPREDIDLDLVKKSAELAQAADFIESDTLQGFDTIIGEHGVRLSGGQRQRLGLARAFYLQPDVLFLDEATSALDSVTEEAVMHSIENRMPGITVVMIAHRLSTVKFCDTIFYIEKGRVVDSGNFKDLTISCPAFRQMVEVGDQKV